MNHITEVKYIEHLNTHQTIKKLSNDEYVVLSTGEIKKYKNSSSSRADNSASLRTTFKKLRNLINNNFVGGDDELFITLTYSENMTDHKRLGYDFKKFWLRFSYRFPNSEYIRVSEPQARGSWHLHVLIKNVSYISNDDLSSMWNLGFVKVNRIKEVDNIGAYITAYLSDMPLDELDSSSFGNVVEKDISDGSKKKIVKGARLKLYPRGMNYFTKSKGIVYPETITMSYAKAQKKTSSAKLVFSKNVFIDNDGFTNNIITEIYNSKS